MATDHEEQYIESALLYMFFRLETLAFCERDENIFRMRPMEAPEATAARGPRRSVGLPALSECCQGSESRAH